MPRRRRVTFRFCACISFIQSSTFSHCGCFGLLLFHAANTKQNCMTSEKKHAAPPPQKKIYTPLALLGVLPKSIPRGIHFFWGGLFREEVTVSESHYIEVCGVLAIKAKQIWGGGGGGVGFDLTAGVGVRRQGHAVPHPVDQQRVHTSLGSLAWEWATDAWVPTRAHIPRTPLGGGKLYGGAPRRRRDCGERLWKACPLSGRR